MVIDLPIIKLRQLMRALSVIFCGNYVRVNPRKYRVHLIWDNAGYHRNDEVKDFAKVLGIKWHYIPPYSPNLNPVERIWKMMHESVRHNQYDGTSHEFTEATLGFLRNIGRKKCILRDRIADNFQIVHSPLFASWCEMGICWIRVFRLVYSCTLLCVSSIGCFLAEL